MYFATDLGFRVELTCCWMFHLQQSAYNGGRDVNRWRFPYTALRPGNWVTGDRLPAVSIKYDGEQERPMLTVKKLS